MHDAVQSLTFDESGLIRSVTVVDNASSDNSVALLKERRWPFLLLIHESPRNTGFGAACNKGSEAARGEFILFLNPDAKVHPGALTGMVAHMNLKENSDVAICSIKLVDESGMVSRSCARFPSLGSFAWQALGLNRLVRSWAHPMLEWDHESDRRVDHVIGAFYLIRRAVFESLFGFDERFFLYLEDLDLSRRANAAGWKSSYLANLSAFHAGGGTSRQIKSTRLFYSLRSKLAYGFKHFSPAKAWLLAFLTCVIEPLSRVALLLVTGRFRDLSNTLSAYRILYANLWEILKCR